MSLIPDVCNDMRGMCIGISYGTMGRCTSTAQRFLLHKDFSSSSQKFIQEEQEDQ